MKTTEQTLIESWRRVAKPRVQRNDESYQQCYDFHKQEIERLYAKVEKGNKGYIDSIIYSYPSVYNGLTAILSKGNTDKQLGFK